MFHIPVAREFEKALAHTVGVEGDFSDHPDDSGGKTRYGIAEAMARAYGYAGDMRELPWSLAVRIYRESFWDLLRCDEVAALSSAVALELFDTGVNCGVGVSGRFLQRALNALNRQQALYPDVLTDGLVGRMTLSALKSYLLVRGKEGETVLLRALNSLQGAHYIGLAERREKDESFLYGWILRRVEIA